MYSLVYVSSATSLLVKDQLVELLNVARTRNATVGVTGILLYKGGNILQVLEGEESAVKSVYRRISEDGRHRGIIILSAGLASERFFPEWSMGFRDLQSPELIDLPGFSDFLNTSLTAEEFRDAPDRIRRLLLTFKQNM